MSAIQTGPVPIATATTNRQTIESAASIALPVGSVQLDRALSPVSGQSISGPATLSNAYTQTGPYCRTLLCDPPLVGWNYFDSGQVVGPHEFKLADPAAAVNYKPGSPAYLWKLDGFSTPTGQLRTLHGIRSVAGGVVTVLGPPLDPRLNAARWYAQAYVMGDVSAGKQGFYAPSGMFAVGDYAFLTAGPDIANADHGEWHRIGAVANWGITLAWPVQRPYTAAVLAKAHPTAGVTLRGVTIAAPIGGMESALVKYAVNWRCDGMTFDKFCPVSNGYGVYTNCTFGDGSYANSCHDMTFIGCTFNGAWRMEEGSFNLRFEGCSFNGSVGCNTGCERLTFRGCRTGIGAYIGLTANDGTIEALTADGAAFVALAGERWLVRSVMGCPLLLQAGGGVAIDCPTAQIQAGTWRVIP